MKSFDPNIITLKNDTLEIQCIPLGAALIHVSYKQGHNVVVRYQDMEQYLHNNAYLGVMVGPIAGRTKDGLVADLTLSRNDGMNHLHGGNHNVSNHLFQYRLINATCVEFFDTINHEADGYPGSIDYCFRYELMDDSCVLTTYAKPSHAIPLNITNHSYFNLSFTNTLVDHKLQIDAERVVMVDTTNANTNRIIDVTNTAFDFRSMHSILPRMSHEQFAITRYLDHDFILDGVVTLRNENLELTIATDCPVMRVYTANWFDQGFIPEHGEPAQNQSAIAFEPQNLANGYNLTNDPQLMYNKNNPFRSRTVYTLRELL